MKRFLSLLLTTAIIFTLSTLCISAESCSVTYLCEPFSEEKSITATGSPDYWCVSYGLTSNIINTKGEETIKIIATGAKKLRDNVFLLTMPRELKTTEDKFIDFSGNKLLDFKCEIAESINDNCIIVQIDGKYGLYNYVDKNMIIEAEYDMYTFYKNKNKDVVSMLLRKGEKNWIYYNFKTGEKYALPDNLSYSFLSENYLSFMGDKNGISDIRGNVKFSDENGKNVYYVNDNLVHITDYNNKMLYICDMEGNEKASYSIEKYDISPIAPDENGNFRVMSYKTQGIEYRLRGLMSPDGTILTEEKYYYTATDEEGNFVILSDFAGKDCTVVDYSGNVIIPSGKYFHIEYLGKGLLTCDIADEYESELIFISGNEITSVVKYGSVRKLNDKYITAFKDNKMGVIDYSGNVILPFSYESITVLNDFLFTVTKDKKKGIADIYGNEIVECRYDSVIASGAGRYDKDVFCLKENEDNKVTFVEITCPVVPDISVKVNGVKVDFDQAPVIAEGRTLVPLRAIFEALGASVSWDGETRTVTAVKGDVTVSLTIDSDAIYINGAQEKLDVPATIIGGRTLVPARAVSQALNYKVEWDGNLRTVHIYK